MLAIRVRDWKIHFLEQNNQGIDVWRAEFRKTRVPKLYNLRSDPFERGDDSILYDKWTTEHTFIQVPSSGAGPPMDREIQRVSTTGQSREFHR